MSDPALSLDHVGAMVRDLDAGAECWRRLGFRLAPRSPQMGFDKTTGAARPWATANHCAMLRRGYLELIGVVDPSLPNPWARFLDRYEGLHITAFRCAEANAAYSVLAQRAAGFDPPLDRRRDAPFGGGTREMRFRNIFSQDAHYPEGRFIVIEHQTPDVLWQEDLMDHPNGALALDEVIFCAVDLAATRDRIGAILGCAPEEKPGAARFVIPGGGHASVLDEAAFTARFPGAAPPPRPCPAAASVAVADVTAAADLIARNGVTVHEGPDGSIWVPPQQANGCVIAMTEAL